jgi:Yip1 domain
MGVSAPVSSKANGLTTVVNVLTSPREAFETLRIAPTWGWAFVIAFALAAIGQYFATPATMHAVQATFSQQAASNPQLAGMTPEQQQRALNISLSFVRFAWLFTPVSILIVALVTSIVMLVFKAIGRGDATFKQLWCASMNVCVVSVGVYGLLAGLIALVRGAATYNSTQDAFKSVPGLTWLAPHAGLKATAFLSAFNVAGLWAALLIALAMVYVAKTSKLNGAICAVVSLCLTGAFLAWTAR